MGLYFSSSPTPRSDAIVTLVCDDSFVVAAAALLRSLTAVNSDLPVVCLVLDGALSPSSYDALAYSGCTVLTVTPLPGLAATQHACYFLKLRAWSLTQYRRVLFLDADIIATKNMDHVVRTSEDDRLYVVTTCYHGPPPMPCQGGRGIFNSGVMVLTPNATVFSDMVTAPNPRSEVV